MHARVHGTPEQMLQSLAVLAVVAVIALLVHLGIRAVRRGRQDDRHAGRVRDAGGSAETPDRGSPPERGKF